MPHDGFYRYYYFLFLKTKKHTNSHNNMIINILNLIFIKTNFQFTQ